MLQLSASKRSFSLAYPETNVVQTDIFDIEYITDDDELIQIGTIKTSLLRLTHIFKGIRAYDIFDEKQELLDMGHHVYDFEIDEFKEEANAEFAFGNILHIDKISILEKYRGKGIGLIALNCLIGIHSSECRLITLKPFPFSLEDEFQGMKTTATKKLSEKVEKAAIRKLRKYYGLLGFQMVGESEFMSFCTDFCIKSIEEKYPIQKANDLIENVISEESMAIEGELIK